MRADRLLSLLMLLQIRGKMTAQDLATELEVSERTVYRDIEALSTAGVPVYAERGPGGGCSLLEPYRTDLTGLTENELRALFLLSIPTTLSELGLDQGVKAALLKLRASLVPNRRENETWVRQRLYIDAENSPQGEQQPTPFLQVVYRAVCEDRQLDLVLQLSFDTRVEHRVDPYGLVARNNSWQLVCAREGNLHIYRLIDLLDARLLDEHFTRPPEFHLGEFWDQCRRRDEASRAVYEVTARISPALAPILRHWYGSQTDEILAHASVPDSQGWYRVTLPFESLYAARERILGLGRAIEVLEPLPLRQSLIDFAHQIVDFYENREVSLETGE